MLELKGVTVDYGDKRILDNTSFSLDYGHWLMICGPNGAGKSTIVKALSQGCCYKGEISLDGVNISKLKSSSLARKLGFLSQKYNVSYSFTVREVVSLGRYSYSDSVFGGISSNDTEKINEAIEITGLTELADRSVLTLSGGELQRTFLAQLFAQDPKIIVLDEPTNNLDLQYQKQIFELIQDWMKSGERAVISVVHDLSLARLYGTDAILLDHGKIVAKGTHDKVISDEYLNSVYSMDVGEYMRTLLSNWEHVKR